MRVCECGAGITCLSFSMVLQCQVCGCEIEVFYFFLCKCKFCECWCAFVLWNWRAPYVKSAQARSEVSLDGYKARPICVCLHFGRGLSAHDSKSSHLVNPFTAKFIIMLTYEFWTCWRWITSLACSVFLNQNIFRSLGLYTWLQNIEFLNF